MLWQTIGNAMPARPSRGPTMGRDCPLNRVARSCTVRGIAAPVLSPGRDRQNYSGYTDREVDGWFDEQRKENDPVRRKELAQKIERKLIDEAWTLPLTYMSRTVALNRKVMGYKLAPTHVLNTDWRGVWIDQ